MRACLLLKHGSMTSALKMGVAFAGADSTGSCTISNAPRGTYKLKAWHTCLPSQVRDITVPDAGEVKADFTLGVTTPQGPDQPR